MIPRLHAVTDDRVLRRPGFVALAQDVLRAGGRRIALHVRGPGLDGARVFERARSLRPAARAAGAGLLVNDRVDVALVLELSGAHLGERSLPVADARRLLAPTALVGASVHGVEAAREAEVGGADYLVAGTIFRTASHPGRAPAGPDRVREVRSAVDVPLLAIGGVTPERVSEVLGAGADGVAALSGIWDAAEPAGAVGSYLDALEHSTGTGA